MKQVIREVPIEKLSPRLRSIVERLSEDVSGMTQRTFDTFTMLIPDYASITDDAIRRDIFASTTIHSHIWYKSLLTAQPPSPDDLERASEFARRRVHQGVPLAGLLRAFRVGSGVFWRTLLDEIRPDKTLYEEALFKVSPYLIHHFDVIAQNISQAYTAEQYKRARWRDRLRHELSGIVLNRPDDEAAFNGHTQALGVDGSTPHTALALRLIETPGITLELEDGLDRMLIGVARALGVERERLVRAVHHGQLLLWLPVPHGEPMIAGEQKLAKQVATLVGPAHNIAAAGVGLPGIGATGWHHSAVQARKALELGPRLHPEDSVHRYSDIVLDDAALGSGSVTRFLEGLIERLSGEPDLLETLQVFFEKDQHRKAVAGELGIHPNTLNYRLDRIEALLGARLSDMGWLAKLNTALRLRQISQPPEPPQA